MNQRIAALSTLVLIGCSQMPAPRQITPVTDIGSAITEKEIADHIHFLADDALEGRYPGTPGSVKAADYIISQWKAAGIEPAGSDGYYQNFEFITGISLSPGNSLKLDDMVCNPGLDYLPLAYSSPGELAADVVFAGYGFAIEDSLKWNDYDGLDVEGKWVLIFRGDPEPDNPHSEFAPHAALRNKILVARDRGADGVIFVSPDQAPFAPDELIPLSVTHGFTDAGIAALHITRKTAEQLFDGTGYSLKSIQTEIDSAMAPHSMILNHTASAAIALAAQSKSVANLVGVIPGGDPALADQYIVLGAHYDHLGYGGKGSGSLSPDTVAIHNGADDNASGVAGILELGERLIANRGTLHRSVLLVCFNGEEEGLLGSKTFTKNPLVPLDKIAVMINLDMIGRYSEKLVIGGVGTAPGFEGMLNDLSASSELTVKQSPEGYGPSDHASFYVENVPVLFFFTGTHGDYHKPSDDWDKINVGAETAILDYVYRVAMALDQNEEKPLFTEAGPKQEATASRRGFKVTLGIIPSYGSTVAGLEIDGTKPEGPAGKVGMQKGDIILAMDGKEIKDIYDYMYRLAELKAGQILIVKVKRGDETLELSLQL